MRNPLKSIELSLVVILMTTILITLTEIGLQHNFIGTYEQIISQGFLYGLLSVFLLIPLVGSVYAHIKPTTIYAAFLRKQALVAIVIVYVFQLVVRLLDYGLLDPRWSTALGPIVFASILYWSFNQYAN
jgi:hypothetical protein